MMIKKIMRRRDFSVFMHLLSGALITMTFTSCVVVINDAGYSFLPAEEKQRVVKCDRPIDSLRYDGKIYQVDASMVWEYVEGKGNVIVYNYLPFCSGEYCINPKAAEQICSEHGFGFCLVASSYDKLSLVPELGVPVLAIDTDTYGTNNYKRLGRKFYDELTGTTYKARGYGSFHRFDNGHYVKTYNDINDAFEDISSLETEGK